MALIARIGSGVLGWAAELAAKGGFVCTLMGGFAMFIDISLGLPAFLCGLALLGFSFVFWPGRRRG